MWIISKKNYDYIILLIKNMRIPISSVPFDTTVDIPFVPKPYSGIKYKMGGTTPPFDSILNSTDRKYQITSPRLQNTLMPLKTNTVNNTITTINNDSDKECYNIYSSKQNIQGKICNTIGSDTELTGHGDWFRGNNFGVDYSDKIFDRKKYSSVIPSVKENNIRYISTNGFYPTKVLNRYYPHTNNYTSSGEPIWKYPHNVKLNISKPDLIETFINKKCYSSCNPIFWFGILVILFIYFILYNK